MTRGGGASGGFVETRTKMVDCGFRHEKIATNRKGSRRSVSVNDSGGV